MRSWSRVAPSVLIEDVLLQETEEERLHGGGVPTGGNSAHGDDQTVAGEGLVVLRRTDLACPVRVHDAASNIAAHTDGIGERVNSEPCFPPRVDRVADDPVGEDVP